MTGQAYAVLPPDAHPPYSRPCRGCGGTGLTGDQYEFRGDPGRPVLLVDVICPACTGCGNGDPDHEECATAAHAYPDYDDDDTWGDDDPDWEPGGCPSCGPARRGWNAVQAWPDDNPDGMVVLRVACGCASPRLVTLPGEGA